MNFNYVYQSSEAQISSRLADEVRYLHSLWRQGPPKRSSAAKNNSERNDSRNKTFEEGKKQSNEETATASKIGSEWETELNVEQPKRFKNSKKRKNEETAPLSEIKERTQHVTRSEWKIKENGEWPQSFKKQKHEETTSTSKIEKRKTDASNLEWKVEGNVETADGAWISVTTDWNVGEIEPKLRQETVHQRAVKAFRNFLAEGLEDESFIEEEEDESEDSSDDDDGYISKEDRVMKFFVDMFEKDAELRSYYEENCNCGSFECFVCSAIGQKIGKRFPNCDSLIQHALTLLKTKRMASHRGYGKALCAILGWNANRLPNLKSSATPRGCIPTADLKQGASERAGDMKVEDDKNEEQTDRIEVSSSNNIVSNRTGDNDSNW
eukprot:TRINITY_DN5349_c0_g1_i1.p1 TRINITY_DN5349_c0_g1~~TRINITY_DN5349_c0_g1_i1.p1  ORF type:complete len:381 (+),score=56.68 TRINITY_DN5349_c0_g1_i1:211-1353(+)